MRDRAHINAEAPASAHPPSAKTAMASHIAASVPMPPVRHRSRPVLVVSNDPPAAKTAGEQATEPASASDLLSDALPMGRAVSAGGASASKPDYDVGYGKPPAATRFKKGQSGNPKGRPKKADSAVELLRKQLDTVVFAKVDGKTKKMSLLEAGISQMMKSFVSGDKKAFAIVMNMLGEAGASTGQRKQTGELAPAEPAGPAPLDASGRAALADYNREQLRSDGYSDREVEGILATMGLVAPPVAPKNGPKDDDDVVI